MMDLTKLKSCELFLFDMDGTLYLGDNVYPGAHELMEALPSLGKRYIYLTNNSSRAGEDYITRLRRLGFPCEAENVFTSGMATGLYLNQNYPGAKVYLAGTRAFYRELQSYKINLVWGCTVSPSEETHETINESPEPEPFSWEFDTIPVSVTGHKATAHMEIDSTKFKTEAQKAALAAFEDILYGTDGTPTYNEFTGSAFVEGTDYYERTGTGPNYVYTKTTDATYNSQKTYYTVSYTGATTARLPLPDEVISRLTVTEP